MMLRMGVLTLLLVVFSGCLQVAGPKGPQFSDGIPPVSVEGEIESIPVDVEITAPIASAELPYASRAAQALTGTCTYLGGDVSITVNASSAGTTPCLSDGTFTTTLDFTSISVGSATLAVSQTAQAGTSYQTSDSASVVVVNGAPIPVDVAITAPAGGTRIVYSTRLNQTVSGTCTASVGTINVTGNGTNLGSTPCSGSGTFSLTVDYSSVTGSSITLTVTQIAQSGTSYATTDSDSVNLPSWVEVCSGTGQDTSGKLFAIAGSDGSAGNPHLICTLAQLRNVGAASGLFELRDDIDGNDINGTPQTIPPIGNLTSTSVFEGNHLEIRNLNFSNATGHVGLFAELQGSAIVRNLRLRNLKVTGSTQSSGLLVGYLTGSAKAMSVQLVNSTSYPASDLVSTTTATNNAMGGLVGLIAACTIGADAGVHNSSASGVVVLTQNLATGFSAGGLVGRMSSNCAIRNSTADVRVEGQNWVGGMVGDSHGLISDSIATGDVSGIQRVGGFIGRMNAGTVQTSIARGNVSLVTGTPLRFIGGFVGMMTDGIITRCGAENSSVNGTGGWQVGGFLGHFNTTVAGAFLTRNYALANVQALDVAGGFVGGGGMNANGTMLLEDVSARGNVIATSSVGSFLGSASGGASITIRRATALGSVSGTPSGRFFSAISVPSQTITHAFYNSDVNTATTVNGQPLTDAQLRDPVSYPQPPTFADGFDFPTLWNINPAVSPYPRPVTQ